MSPAPRISYDLNYSRNPRPCSNLHVNNGPTLRHCLRRQSHPIQRGLAHRVCNRRLNRWHIPRSVTAHVVGKDEEDHFLFQVENANNCLGIGVRSATHRFILLDLSSGQCRGTAVLSCIYRHFLWLGSPTSLLHCNARVAPLDEGRKRDRPERRKKELDQDARGNLALDSGCSTGLRSLDDFQLAEFLIPERSRSKREDNCEDHQCTCHPPLDIHGGSAMGLENSQGRTPSSINFCWRNFSGVMGLSTLQSYDSCDRIHQPESTAQPGRRHPPNRDLHRRCDAILCGEDYQ